MTVAVIVLILIGILAVHGALSGLDEWIKDADFKDMENTI